MAGPIGLKLGGMVEGICKNILGKPRWPPKGLFSKKECFVFIGLSVVYKLRDGWTYWAETCCNGRGQMPERSLEGFFGFLESKMAAKWIIKIKTNYFTI